MEDLFTNPTETSGGSSKDPKTEWKDLAISNYTVDFDSLDTILNDLDVLDDDVAISLKKAIFSIDENTKKLDQNKKNLEDVYKTQDQTSTVVQTINVLLDIIAKQKDSNISTMRSLEEERERAAKYKALLKKKNADMRKDDLTGLENDKWRFQDCLSNHITNYRKSGTAFCCALIDLDYFKMVNDTFGHDTGDIVLKRLAYFLKKHLSGFKLFRWWGEEFTVVAKCSADELNQRVEEMRKHVNNHKFYGYDKSGKRTDFFKTFSCGITEFKWGDDNREDLFKRADKLMYEAKEGGRNATRIG